MSELNKISVIFPVFNRLDYTKMSFPMVIKECLDSKELIESIFVYDDMSTDGSYEFVKSIVDKYSDKLDIKLIHKEIGNSTFQINHTYRNTNAKYLIKVDNDIVVPNGYIRTLHESIEKHDHIGFLMMPEVSCFSFIKDKTKLSLGDRSHIGGVGIFRKSIFDKLGDIKSGETYFGFTHYQNTAIKELGVKAMELRGSGNLNLDSSPVYSRVYYYESMGWGRNLWKGVKSITDNLKK